MKSNVLTSFVNDKVWVLLTGNVSVSFKSEKLFAVNANLEFLLVFRK